MYKYCSQNILFYKVFFDKRSHSLRMPKNFYFFIFPLMRKTVSLLAVASFLVTPFASAQSTDSTLNAAPNNTAVTATSTSLGEYKSVSCDSNTIFSQNSCNQCFVGSAVKKGEKLNGLFDNWENTTSGILVAYRDEQKNPEMVSLGGSKWASTPADASAIWKYSSDVLWTPANGRDSYMLTAGQKIRFVESDMGAGYTLTETTAKHGDVIGLLKFPIVYRTLDTNTANEGASETHYECVSYTLDAPVVTPTEEPTPNKPTTPPEATQTETGPAETLLLIVAAFFIAFGLMFSLRKRA